MLDLADIAQVDADLTVLDLAQAAAPLPLDTDGGVPLGEGRRSRTRTPLGLPTPAHPTGQLAEPARVPGRLADELLQWPPWLVMEVGDGLDVLVLQVGIAPGDISASPPPPTFTREIR